VLHSEIMQCKRDWIRKKLKPIVAHVSTAKKTDHSKPETTSMQFYFTNRNGETHE